jgi:hypothetical protein
LAWNTESPIICQLSCILIKKNLHVLVDKRRTWEGKALILLIC